MKKNYRKQLKGYKQTAEQEEKAQREIENNGGQKRVCEKQ